MLGNIGSSDIIHFFLTPDKTVRLSLDTVRQALNGAHCWTRFLPKGYIAVCLLEVWYRWKTLFMIEDRGARQRPFRKVKHAMVISMCCTFTVRRMPLEVHVYVSLGF